MKNIIKIILIQIICLVPLSQVNADSTNVFNGDLQFRNGGYPMHLVMEIASLPFEGYNDTSNHFNRTAEIYNGILHKKFFYDNEYKIRNIAYTEVDIPSPGIGRVYTMHGCHREDWLAGTNPPTSFWGFAKYKITIEVDSVTFMFYWNILDSQYGRSYAPGVTLGYYRDWSFEYSNDSLIGKVIFYSSSGEGTHDTIFPSQTGKELSVWKSLSGNDEPFERKFYARTTPFGVNHTEAENRRIDLVLGTTVILDTVYPNINPDTNRYGYNTVNIWGSPAYEYYSNPQIPIRCADCDSGNVYTTPGRAHFNQQTFKLEGIKITAESGDTLILKNKKRLYIIGVGGVPPDVISDTIHFKPGSCLRMEEDAEICTFKGGVLIDENSCTILASNSCFCAFANSTIDLRGTNPVINNEAFMVIAKDGNLKLADNTTLTIDGEGSYLKLDTNAKVYLGENSKIEVKNGAYIDADSAQFICSSTWEGIVLDNPGVQTKITNCTFNNAKKTITLTNDSVNAYNNYEIRNNTFNQPDSTAYAIYVENAFNLQITGNTLTPDTTEGTDCLTTIT